MATATKDPLYATELILLVVPEVEILHVDPSTENSIVPVLPPAIHPPELHTIPFRLFAVPEVFNAQFVPFVEVNIVPVLPTATYWVNERAIEFKFVVAIDELAIVYVVMALS